MCDLAGGASWQLTQDAVNGVVTLSLTLADVREALALAGLGVAR